MQCPDVTRLDGPGARRLGHGVELCGGLAFRVAGAVASLPTAPPSQPGAGFVPTVSLISFRPSVELEHGQSGSERLALSRELAPRARTVERSHVDCTGRQRSLELRAASSRRLAELWPRRDRGCPVPVSSVRSANTSANGIATTHRQNGAHHSAAYPAAHQDRKPHALGRPADDNDERQQQKAEDRLRRRQIGVVEAYELDDPEDMAGQQEQREGDQGHRADVGQHRQPVLRAADPGRSRRGRDPARFAARRAAARCRTWAKHLRCTPAAFPRLARPRPGPQPCLWRPQAVTAAAPTGLGWPLRAACRRAVPGTIFDQPTGSAASGCTPNASTPPETSPRRAARVFRAARTRQTQGPVGGGVVHRHSPLTYQAADTPRVMVSTSTLVRTPSAVHLFRDLQRYPRFPRSPSAARPFWHAAELLSFGVSA